MATMYKKVQNKNSKSPSNGKWYGRAVILQSVGTKKLAEEISHATTVTQADVFAVLSELSVKMKEHLLRSERVVLDNIGAFKVGLKTKPAETKKDFGANNIVGARIIFQPLAHVYRTADGEGKSKVVYVKEFLDGLTPQLMPETPAAAAAGTAGETDKPEA